MSKHKHHEVAESMDGPKLEPESAGGQSGGLSVLAFFVIITIVIAVMGTLIGLRDTEIRDLQRQRNRLADDRCEEAKRAINAEASLRKWESFRPTYEKFQAEYAAYLAAQGCKCGCQQAPCQCDGGCCK